MRMLGHLADKLLGAVVPQISASACCTGACRDLHRELRLRSQWHRLAEDVRGHLLLHIVVRRVPGLF